MIKIEDDKITDYDNLLSAAKEVLTHPKEYQNKIQHGTIFYSTLGKDGGSDERDNLIHALEMRQLNNETIKKYGMTYDEYCKHVTKYGKESNKLF